MTAIRAVDQDELLAGLREAEGEPDQEPHDEVIFAAEGGIRLLSALIRELALGKTPTCTIQEIGQALVGRPAPPPNWYEKVTLAKRQDKLLRQTARLLAYAIATMDNDIYATRVANAMAYIEDAYDELKDDYAPEGDES